MSTIKNQYQTNQTQSTVDQNNNFNMISQELIMQNLSHYFMLPSTKPIPYVYYFTKHSKWFIYALSYLYNFIRATHHSKIVNQIFMKMLYVQDRNDKQIQIKQQNNKSIQGQQNKIGDYIRIIIQGDGHENQGTISRKVLLNRYISLPSMMAEYLTNKKINPKHVEQNIIYKVCKNIQKLNYQQKSYIVNKIIMLGYTIMLIKAQKIQIIIQIYEYIVRKDTVLFVLLKQILNKPTQRQPYLPILYTILQNFHKNDYSIFVNLFNNQYFIPQHAEKLYIFLISKFYKLALQIFQNLLIWWAEGNDHYLIYNMVKFRANLIALSLTNFQQKQVIHYSALLSLGIERRLMSMTQAKKQVIELIWGQLSKKIGIKLQKKFQTKLLKNDQTETLFINQTNQQLKEAKHNNNKKQIKKQQNYQQQQILQEQDKNLTNNYEQKQQSQSQILQLVPKGPRNLYDCILGLRNPSRKSITLQFLPKLIRSYPDDLIFIWHDIVQQLLYNLNEQTTPSVVALFVTRPQNFIQSISTIFFKKQHSLNDKIILMQIINQGVQQLSQKPKQVHNIDTKQSFYFKKVKSKYYNEKDQNKLENKIQKQDSRTRRWGHTRIAYQNKIKQANDSTSTVSLKIMNSQPYINRLYEIATQLFFIIISKLTLLSIFPSQPMFTAPMLKLLATLSYNLKNHIQKYKILTQIVDICLFVIQYVQDKRKKITKQKLTQQQQIKKFIKRWKQTHLGVINTLNKISLVLDKYIPERILQNLDKCLVKLKNSNQYGIGPIISMVQANIYTNVSGQIINL